MQRVRVDFVLFFLFSTTAFKMLRAFAFSFLSALRCFPDFGPQFPEGQCLLRLGRSKLVGRLRSRATQRQEKYPLQESERERVSLRSPAQSFAQLGD
jgi:hypothetical protein